MFQLPINRISFVERFYNLIIGLCILLRVYQLNIGTTSVSNKEFFGARLYFSVRSAQ
jgi:hypothetical protein